MHWCYLLIVFFVLCVSVRIYMQVVLKLSYTCVSVELFSRKCDVLRINTIIIPGCIKLIFL